jgi:hypothetical protein
MPRVARCATLKSMTPISDDKRANLRQRGTLIVLDNFATAESHGQGVVKSARDEGFRGQVIEFPLPSADRISLTRRTATDLALLKRTGISPQKFRATLKDFDTAQQVGVLNQATADLRRMCSLGVNHSAINISYGASKAILVEHENQLLDKGLLGSAAAAFGVEGTNRVKLEQGLIDVANQASDGNREIAQAKASYDRAVLALAANHVAVDVSAGNDATIESDMAAGNAAGTGITTPANFHENLLGNALTRVIGAEGQLDASGSESGEGIVANYSSPSTFLTRYAHGMTELNPPESAEAPRSPALATRPSTPPCSAVAR